MDEHEVSFDNFCDGSLRISQKREVSTFFGSGCVEIRISWQIDLTSQIFDSFDMNLRVRWSPVEQHWHVLSRFLEHSKEFHSEMKKRKSEVLPQEPKKRKIQKRLDPW